MTEPVAAFDAAAYLDNGEVMAEYLTAALEDPDPSIFLAALSHVAKARGMSQVAEKAKLGRESLYKAVAPGAHPRYETIRSVIDALGLKLTISA
ncbi:MAG: putative addiction module antidote protein [Phaeospirillum sp.]|nr:putative addiction module antidote protein [Phaeospirillum sp.]